MPTFWPGDALLKVAIGLKETTEKKGVQDTRDRRSFDDSDGHIQGKNSIRRRSNAKFNSWEATCKSRRRKRRIRIEGCTQRLWQQLSISRKCDLHKKHAAEAATVKIADFRPTNYTEKYPQPQPRWQVLAQQPIHIRLWNLTTAFKMHLPMHPLKGTSRNVR